jgi:hypothetical protein
MAMAQRDESDSPQKQITPASRRTGTIVWLREALSKLFSRPDTISGFEYNTDILVTSEDMSRARREFPTIFHALYHKALIDKFLQWDERTSAARGRVRRRGLCAIAFGSLALLSSALQPLLVHEISPWQSSAALQAAQQGGPPQSATPPKQDVWGRSVFVAIDLVGILGTAIAVAGLWLETHKREWLLGRFMCERLRQWHFQFLVCKATMIGSCYPLDERSRNASKFIAERKKLFDKFIQDLEANLEVRKELFLDQARPEEAYRLLHDADAHQPTQTPALDFIFKAYDVLRFRHQGDYARSNLRQTTDRPLWKPLQWPAAVLERRTDTWSRFFLAVAFVASMISIGIELTNQYPEVRGSGILPAAILIFAVFNVATRSIQTGLTVHEDTQRYREYASKAKYLRGLFDAETDNQKRLDLLVEMEVASQEELRSFLWTNENASFI